MHFSGRIISRGDAVGTYRIVLTKSGPAGISRISQGGRFSASAGAETIVGSATLSIEQGAGYSVQMNVESGGRTFTCNPLKGDKR